MMKFATATALALVLGLAAGGTAPATAATAQNDGHAGAAASAEGSWSMSATMREARALLEAAAQELRDAADADATTLAREKARKALNAVEQALNEAERTGKLTAREVGTRLRDQLNDARSDLLKKQDQVAAALDEVMHELDGSAGTAATQVKVEQNSAKVNVEQPAAQVKVQQAAPQVTVTQPAPKVTIVQPEPTVTVQQAETKVTVVQTKPTVQVEQAKPEVKVEQVEPKVTVVQAQPTVQVEQAKPEVKVEQAEARVETDMKPSATAEAGTAVAARSDLTSAWYARFTAKDLADRDVRNTNDDEVGEIEKIVYDASSGKVFAVVSVGGFLGIGEKHVLIPADRLRMGEDDILLLSAQDEEQLKAMPAYKDGMYKEIAAEMRIGDAIAR